MCVHSCDNSGSIYVADSCFSRLYVDPWIAFHKKTGFALFMFITNVKAILNPIYILYFGEKMAVNDYNLVCSHIHLLSKAFCINSLL